MVKIILKRNPDGEISYEELIDGLRTGNEEEIKKGLFSNGKGLGLLGFLEQLSTIFITTTITMTSLLMKTTTMSLLM